MKTYTRQELPFEKYLADTSAVSSSWMKIVLERSPKHLKHRLDDPESAKVTPALQKGRLVHTAILEPDTLTERYLSAPKKGPAKRTVAGLPVKNSNAGKDEIKELLQAAGERELVGFIDYDNALALRDAVWQTKTGKLIMSKGRAETSCYWDDEATGAKCKARADWLRADEIIFDLKSAENANYQAFSKAIVNYKYDLQAAHYADGLEVDKFAWIVVEPEPPHGVAFYPADQEILERGRVIRSVAMDVIAQCMDKEEWPGYEDGFTPIYLPGWAKLSNYDDFGFG